MPVGRFLSPSSKESHHIPPNDGWCLSRHPFPVSSLSLFSVSLSLSPPIRAHNTTCGKFTICLSSIHLHSNMVS